MGLFGGHYPGAFVPVTAAQVITALKNITARNYFFSQKWAADGKESSGLVTFSPTNRSSVYSGSSSISPSFSFSVTATPTLAIPCLETSNLTFVTYNIASTTMSLSVDGVAASGGQVSAIGDGAAVDQRAYKFTISKALRTVATVNPTFGKTTGEPFNSQVMHLIPALWNTQDSGVANETLGGANLTFTVAQNDLIFILVSQGSATPTGTATSTLIMNRNAGNNEYVYAINTAGTFIINPSGFTVGSFSYNHAFFAIQLRFAQA
jgi:hypothetical protein